MNVLGDAAIAITTALLGWGCWSMPSWAQAVGEAGFGTVVTPGGNALGSPPNSGLEQLISGGRQAGGNLFHSFLTFSVPTGGSATFVTGSEVERIFARVSGDQASHVDGLLQANADLFLFNPQGLIFGENAQLQVNGSFIGSTAEQITFQGGFQFGSSTAPGLLTVSQPVGLQLGNAQTGAVAAPIVLSGQGNQLSSEGVNANPLLLGDRDRRFVVPTGKTLALAGGSLQLEGASLIAPDGLVSLNAVAQGEIGLTQESDSGMGDRWRPSAVAQGGLDWGDIHLSDRALLEVSGQTGGQIQLRGDNLSFTEGSLALIQSAGHGAEQSGIEIDAKTSLNLDGIILDQSQRGGLISQAELGSSGTGASIRASAPRIDIQNGAAAVSYSFSSAQAGAVTINAQERLVVGADDALQLPVPTLLSSIAFAQGNAGELNLTASNVEIMGGSSVSSITLGEGQGGNLNLEANAIALSGYAAGEPSTLSNIAALAFNRGDAGDLSIHTETLLLETGATVISAVFNAPPLVNANELREGAGQGKGGALTVKATESITVRGSNPIVGNGSVLGSITYGRGDADRTWVQTPLLQVEQGGQISASTSSKGNAGQLQIDSDVILVRGRSTATSLPSEITANAIEQPSLLQQLFHADPIPAGNTGELRIRAREIRLEEGGTIGVQHGGVGNAGQLTIESDSVAIASQGRILAETASGAGGNVQLSVTEILSLLSGGTVSVEAGNSGNGGNIAIDADFIVLAGQSQIKADAAKGNGGNIAIEATGLFPSPDSEITASSRLGVNGTIEVSQLLTMPGENSVELPSRTSETQETVSASCREPDSNSFTASGKGGVPISPAQLLDVPVLWSDAEEYPASTQSLSVQQPSMAIAKPPSSQLPSGRIEAMMIQKNRAGAIELVGQSRQVVATASCLADR